MGAPSGERSRRASSNSARGLRRTRALSPPQCAGERRKIRRFAGTRGAYPTGRGAPHAAQHARADQPGERLDEAPVAEEPSPRFFPEALDARLGRQLGQGRSGARPHAEVPRGFREARLVKGSELRGGDAFEVSVRTPEPPDQPEHELLARLLREQREGERLQFLGERRRRRFGGAPTPPAVPAQSHQDGGDARAREIVAEELLVDAVRRRGDRDRVALLRVVFRENLVEEHPGGGLTRPARPRCRSGRPSARTPRARAGRPLPASSAASGGAPA